MSKIKIVEALCGCGKSYWMIEEMRKHPDEKWIWVTPFLDEAGDDDSNKVGRVREQAPELNFQTPSAKTGCKSKTKHLASLLFDGENVAITHNLFMMMTKDMVNSVGIHGYNIVIDETIEKVSIHESKNKSLVDDVKHLIASGFILKGDRSELSWVGNELAMYNDIKELCDNNMLYLHNDRC